MGWKQALVGAVAVFLLVCGGCAGMEAKGLWPESRQQDAEELKEQVGERLEDLEEDLDELRDQIAPEEGEAGETMPDEG